MGGLRYVCLKYFDFSYVIRRLICLYTYISIFEKENKSTKITKQCNYIALQNYTSDICKYNSTFVLVNTDQTLN